MPLCICSQAGHRSALSLGFHQNRDLKLSSTAIASKRPDPMFSRQVWRQEAESSASSTQIREQPEQSLLLLEISPNQSRHTHEPCLAWCHSTNSSSMIFHWRAKCICDHYMASPAYVLSLSPQRSTWLLIQWLCWWASSDCRQQAQQLGKIPVNFWTENTSLVQMF